MVFCPFDHVGEVILDQKFCWFWAEIRRDKLNFMSIGVFSIYGKILLAHSPNTFIFFRHAKITSYATVPLRYSNYKFRWPTVQIYITAHCADILYPSPRTHSVITIRWRRGLKSPPVALIGTGLLLQMGRCSLSTHCQIMINIITVSQTKLSPGLQDTHPCKPGIGYIKETSHQIRMVCNTEFE